MFSALWRYMRALGYLVTGRIDAARMALSTSPYLIQATYDRIISDKRKHIQQYRDSIAAMIAQEEKKKNELRSQSEQMAELRKLREGAAAMAKQVVERHVGNADAVKRDPEYQKCQAAFKDFGSTLEEKEGRCAQLEEDVKTLANDIAGHKLQLQSLLRELDKLSQEKHETVAEIISAKEEKELADMVSGLSQDRTNQELQELRDLRSKAKAGARVSREMAGLDAKKNAAEFLEYASRTASDNEFDRLIGLAKDSAGSASEKPDADEKGRLPEK